MDPLFKAAATANVWIVPIVYISHVRCFLQFGKQLASHGVTVTFFCTKEDAERLGIHGPGNSTVESWKRDGLDIRLKDFGVEGQELAEGVSDEGDKWCRAINEQEEKFELILKRELELGLPRPTCVISDLWCPGVHATAVKYNVPAWVFSSFSVGCTASIVYLYQLRSKGILELPASHLDEGGEEFISLPGMPLMRIREIDSPSSFVTSLIYPIGKRIGPTLQHAQVILFSTFQELETRPMIELKKLLQNAATKENREAGEVYPIGPTFNISSKGSAESPAANGHEEGERDPSLKFLDTQAESSVLFVAFGCNWNLPPKQMQEIALGLESSGQPFLCSFHPPIKTAEYPTDDIFDVLPVDCVERTKGQGLFVQGWVPQMEILRHPATGGFLSHCGHNSYLESVSMGVPVITWPLYGDQFMNARWIVDEIQAGVEVTKGWGTLDLVDRKELETKVRALFQSEEGKTVRKNALRTRELALQSGSENGSSYNNMKTIVARLKDMTAGRTTQSSNPISET